MKESIIKVLHYILGYERYLKIFSIFKIRTLSFDGRKSDFLFFNELLDENAKVVVIGACTGITTIPLAKDKEIAEVLQISDTACQKRYQRALKELKEYLM